MCSDWLDASTARRRRVFPRFWLSPQLEEVSSGFLRIKACVVPCPHVHAHGLQRVLASITRWGGPRRIVLNSPPSPTLFYTLILCCDLAEAPYCAVICSSYGYLKSLRSMAIGNIYVIAAIAVIGGGL